MPASPGYISHLLDLLRPLPGVEARRMFGGAGLFRDSLMFALVDGDDTLFFKADESTRADFEAEGMAPFTYRKRDGEHMLTSYWRAPERLFDEPDELVEWARRAVEVSRRKSSQRPKRAKSSRERSPPSRGARKGPVGTSPATRSGKRRA